MNEIRNIGIALIRGIVAYSILLVMLRLSGKRTLSKLNMFDFVVTVAFGSTLATILLNQNVSLLFGASLFALLIVVQYGATWLSVRFPLIRKYITGKPTLVFYNQKFLIQQMKSVRVTKSELLQAIRSAGIGSVSMVKAIVVETNGNISVITELKDIFSAYDFPLPSTD